MATMTEAQWLKAQRTLSQAEVDRRTKIHDRDDWTAEERRNSLGRAS